jgi:hypothetical protein
MKSDNSIKRKLNKDENFWRIKNDKTNYEKMIL